MVSGQRLQAFARGSQTFFVSRDSRGYRISIPVKSTVLVALPAILVLGGCVVTVLWNIDRFLRFEGIGMTGIVSLVAIAGGTVTCCFIFYWWLWMVAGGETVRIGTSSLTIERDILGITRTTEYDLLFVRDLRVELLPPSPITHAAMLNWRGGGGCCLVFDYQGEPIYFGIGLFEDDADALADAIRQEVHIPDRPGRKKSLEPWRDRL